MIKFYETVEQNLGLLERYVPVVAKVHGGAHPEFHDVRRLFDDINGKVKNDPADKPDLDNELIELRKITDNYKVPGDVCESYEAVYKMLEEIDREYQK